MAVSNFIFLLSALFAGFFWGLAAIPFTYSQVIEYPLIPGLQLAGNAYLLFYFLSGMLVLRKLPGSRTKTLIILSHIAFSILSAFAVFFIKDLALPYRQAMMLIQAGMLSFIGIYSFSTVTFFKEGDKNRELRSFCALLLTALLCIAIFGSVQELSFYGSFRLIILLMLVYPVGIIIRSFSRLMPSIQDTVEQYTTYFFVTFAIYWFIRYQMLHSVGASGPLFEATAMLLALGTVSFLIAYPVPQTPVPLTLLLILCFSGLMILSVFQLQKLDWDFLGQKTLLLLSAAVAFFLFNRLLEGMLRKPAWAQKKKNAYINFVFLFLSAILAVTLRFIPESNTANAAENFAQDLLQAKIVDNDDFYFFLHRNANLPLSTPLTLPDLQKPTTPEIKPEKLPNIFIIVIDSLRRDYLGVYNKAVKFTPAIDQFAADSFIFQNAFTRFGATGLSQPAIWAGAMIPHQIYPVSFRSLNSLEKLLMIFPYRKLVGKDSVLKAILSTDFSFEEIDARVSEQEFDLCTTLGNLQTQIGSPAELPVFAYTQPQNLHVSVLARKKTVAFQNYPGFYPGYADSLSTIDRCFGEFISYLKKINMYNDSVIVLTSDHGDSLGEEGRFGHAYTLFPEIVRIPLLIHLPKDSPYLGSIKTTGVVFQTDITPTLYHLLGLAPQQDSIGIRGKSLLLAPRPASDSHLLASSYGPVFALLSRNGTNLKIFDAINLRDYAFDLSGDVPKQLTDVSASEKVETMKIIKSKIGEWHGFYDYKN